MHHNEKKIDPAEMKAQEADRYYQKQQYPEAFKCYQEAIKLGSLRVHYDLGWMYAKGHGVPQDDKKAVEYYQHAAVQGYAAAQFFLGIIYQEGRGVTQDDQKAVEYCIF